jgi:pimeloyl-ACP methyl ester carboxylesterase
MSLLRVNAQGTALHLHQSTRPVAPQISSFRDTEGPAIIMIHGFKYLPHDPANCPHRTLFSDDWPNSWPPRLGLFRDTPTGGLGIALGWTARSAVWTAYREAKRAGVALARLVTILRNQTPDRPVHVIGHSMGTAVALEALHHLAPGGIDRIVSLTGAVFASDARAALRSPGAARTEFFNITSRENDLFEFLFERLVQPRKRGDMAMGRAFKAPNATTIALDCPNTLDHLAKRGAPIDGTKRRFCHWSSYTRDGALDFYAQLMRHPERWPLARLQTDLPDTASARWSHLLARATRPLPFGQKTA